jgi:amino acid transporter
MWFNLAVSFVFLFFFRGWGKLAAVISVATIVTYLVVPISVLTLRRTAPALSRPLRLPGLNLLAPAAFVLATLMLYWARWPNTGEIMLLLLLPLPVYLHFQRQAGWPDWRRNLRGAWWLIGYLGSLAVLSWAGSSQFGGRGYLGYGWDQLCVALVALVFCFWGVRSGWRTPAVEAATNSEST